MPIFRATVESSLQWEMRVEAADCHEALDLARKRSADKDVAELIGSSGQMQRSRVVAISSGVAETED